MNKSVRSGRIFLWTNEVGWFSWAQEDMLRFAGLKGDPGTTKRKTLNQAFSVWIHEDSSFHSLSKVRSSCRVWIVWSTGGMMSWKTLIFMSGVNGTGKQRSLTKWEFQELKPIRETELHVFCDASQDAYGACAYLRRAFTDDTVECSLIAEKAVFPL